MIFRGYRAGLPGLSFKLVGPRPGLTQAASDSESSLLVPGPLRCWRPGPPGRLADTVSLRLAESAREPPRRCQAEFVT